MKKIMLGMSILSVLILRCLQFEDTKITSCQGVDKMAIYVLGEEVYDMPKKESGMTISSESHCNNGVTISWDDETWSLKVNYTNFTNNKERTRCELYFEEKVLSPIRVISPNDKNGLWEYKSTITKLVIQDKLEEIPNAIKVSDESELQDKSIMSYVVPNEDGTTYTAYLQGNKKILLNQDSSSLFYNFSKLQIIEGMKHLDTTNVKYMIAMFEGCNSLTSLDLSSFNTKNAVSMWEMFASCSSLTSLDLTNFDTTNVTDMKWTFSGCSSLTSLDLSAFNPENVKDMDYMFSGCSSLTNLDLSSFDTKKATTMGNMFEGCSSLTNLDLSSFNTTNVTDMSEMFSGCSSLTNLDLSSFDTKKATTMGYMFSGCNSLTSLDLSSFNTTNVTNISSMFRYCRKLVTITYGENFVYKSGATTEYMFSQCPANKPTHSSWEGIFS